MVPALREDKDKSQQSIAREQSHQRERHRCRNVVQVQHGLALGAYGLSRPQGDLGPANIMLSPHHIERVDRAEGRLRVEELRGQRHGACSWFHEERCKDVLQRDRLCIVYSL